CKEGERGVLHQGRQQRHNSVWILYLAESFNELRNSRVPEALERRHSLYRLSTRRVLGSKQYGNGFIDSVCIEEAHTYIPFPPTPRKTFYRNQKPRNATAGSSMLCKNIRSGTTVTTRS